MEACTYGTTGDQRLGDIQGTELHCRSSKVAVSSETFLDCKLIGRMRTSMYGSVGQGILRKGGLRELWPADLER